MPLNKPHSDIEALKQFFLGLLDLSVLRAYARSLGRPVLRPYGRRQVKEIVRSLPRIKVNKLVDRGFRQLLYASSYRGRGYGRPKP